MLLYISVGRRTGPSIANLSGVPVYCMAELRYTCRPTKAISGNYANSRSSFNEPQLHTPSRWVASDQFATSVLRGPGGGDAALAHQQTIEMDEIIAGRHSLEDLNSLRNKYWNEIGVYALPSTISALPTISMTDSRQTISIQYTYHDGGELTCREIQKKAAWSSYHEGCCPKCICPILIAGPPNK